MTPSKTDQPPRFVVQCAKGKGWKSLVVEESQALGERAFREVVKVKPRGYFRLIRLDYNPDSDYGGQEFNWKLLALHDPRKGADGSSRRGRRDSGRRRPGEKVPVPLTLYGLAILLGLALAVVLYLLYGPPLTSLFKPPPPAPAALPVPLRQPPASSQPGRP
ncbi:MAG: hypothetical protein WCO00_16120 [Rhodospirillaceae bacterium]